MALSDYMSEEDQRKLAEYARTLPTSTSSTLPSSLTSLLPPVTPESKVDLPPSMVKQEMMPEGYKDIKIKEPSSIRQVADVQKTQPSLPLVQQFASNQDIPPVAPPSQPEEDSIGVAQDKRNKWQQLGALSLFGDIALKQGSGIDLGSEAKQKFYKEMSGQPSANIEERQKLEKGQAEVDIIKEKKDPNSVVSSVYRDALREWGYNIKDNVSALGIEKVFDDLLRSKGLKEQIEQRAVIAEQYRQDRRIRQDELNLQRERDREIRLDQFDQRNSELARKNAENSEAYKDSAKTLTNVSTIKALLDDAHLKGGQSLSMLGPRIAKGIAGEVGVLTEKDVTRYVQNPALVQGTFSTLKRLQSGKLNDSDYENLNRLMDIMEKKALENRSKAYDHSATQFSRKSGKNLNDARYLINPYYDPEKLVPVQLPADKDGKVKKGEIPEREVEGFLKEHPGSKRL